VKVFAFTLRTSNYQYSDQGKERRLNHFFAHSILNAHDAAFNFSDSPFNSPIPAAKLRPKRPRGNITTTKNTISFLATIALPPSDGFSPQESWSVYFPFVQVHLSGGLPHPEHTPFLIGMPQAVHVPL
jgi:hypothetical protein